MSSVTLDIYNFTNHICNHFFDNDDKTIFNEIQLILTIIIYSLFIYYLSKFCNSIYITFANTREEDILTYFNSLWAFAICFELYPHLVANYVITVFLILSDCITKFEFGFDIFLTIISIIHTIATTMLFEYELLLDCLLISNIITFSICLIKIKCQYDY